MPELADADTPTDTALDLGHLPGLVGYALRQAQIAAFRNFSRRFAPFDVRPSQLGILTVIARNPGVKPSDVGAALGIQRANLVPLLNGIEERGLIKRERHAADRRAYALRLTPEGEALLAALMRVEAEHEAELAAGLRPGDRAQLLALLAAVQRAGDQAANGPRAMDGV